MRNALALLSVTMCLAVASYATEASTWRSGPEVTPTSGESWLHHLHRPFSDTSMGKTGRLGPPPDPDGTASAGWQLGLLPASAQEVTVHGADLYRLNCQGCHGENGQGAPPEINSVINPVRATSIPLVMERMKKAGMEISASAASQLAKQSQDALLQRLHQGGESMPPFPQLGDTEIRSLIGYLKQLAGVPGGAQVSVTESPLRVGELIVKSTCHTCHDATGPNPSPQELENGAIPPLDTLTTRTDQLQLIRKVTNGAPILMGTPPTLHRGRMPVFYYLTREEAADVYLYLVTVAPTASSAATVFESPTQQGGGIKQVPPAPPAPSAPPTQSYVSTPAGAGTSSRAATNSGGIPDSLVTIVLLLVGGGVVGLLVLGVGFAGYELRRLGRKHQQPRRVPAMATSPHKDGKELAISSGAGRFDPKAC